MFEVALDRASLWQQGLRTLAGQIFFRAQSSLAQSWVSKSAELLRVYGVADWPNWALRGDKGSYKAFVKDNLCFLSRSVEE